ncbi:hypothetical protein M427DRAFT_50844 [Gonapodya prolifera JEL478]|uniref:AMP-dependent synthetase/ligase domain-containing protein n=1 Tax=Gonapodya prolifera (strain JEL478) TaxID=1344416 RepID=A0A139B1D4_GONPJ|nr:hypothetical protein M427DRAFT_50844 [Gonapodya prolifera JEL478]|eukprot:KXS22545.1 hypothetical protein M427DRAFT_50844 [Gonapodya prolifera JEL478]
MSDELTRDVHRSGGALAFVFPCAPSLLFSSSSEELPRGHNLWIPSDGLHRGEIHVMGPACVDGIFFSDTESKTIADSDGWMRTGITGNIEDGALRWEGATEVGELKE